MVFQRNGSGLGSIVGLGYGLVDKLFVINKVSVDIDLMPSFDEGRRLMITPAIGFGLRLPAPFYLWDAYRFEIGYAFGLRSPFKEDGLKLAVGIESPSIPLGFTHAGVTVRLMYRRFYLERIVQGVFLEFILH